MALSNREKNTRTAELRTHFDGNKLKRMFVSETKAFIKDLPMRNLKLTKKCHAQFVQLVKEIQLKMWDNPDIHKWAEKMMKEEDKEYGQDLAYCHKRLGWKTPTDNTPSEDIRWAD